MKTVIVSIIALSMFGLSCPASAEAPFVIGIAPHTSARVILEMYEPLRVYLEKRFNTQVSVVTAPDFGALAKRALADEYDLIVTTGHQARLLASDAGYIPLLTYKADFKAVAIVAKGNPIRSPEELKGKNALGLSAASFVTIWGHHWLAENGINVPVRYVSASDSVGQLVAAGDADVGFVSLANYQKLAPEVQAQTRIFAESPTMAGRVYLLNKRHAARMKDIDAGLWSFAETEEAKRYFETNKLDGYRKLKAGELEELDKYLPEVRRTIQESGQ